MRRRTPPAPTGAITEGNRRLANEPGNRPQEQQPVAPLRNRVIFLSMLKRYLWGLLVILALAIPIAILIILFSDRASAWDGSVDLPPTNASTVSDNPDNEFADPPDNTIPTFDTVKMWGTALTADSTTLTGDPEAGDTDVIIVNMGPPIAGYSLETMLCTDATVNGAPITTGVSGNGRLAFFMGDTYVGGSGGLLTGWDVTCGEPTPTPTPTPTPSDSISPTASASDPTVAPLEVIGFSMALLLFVVCLFGTFFILRQ